MTELIYLEFGKGFACEKKQKKKQKKTKKQKNKNKNKNKKNKNKNKTKQKINTLGYLYEMVHASC